MWWIYLKNPSFCHSVRYQDVRSFWSLIIDKGYTFKMFCDKSFWQVLEPNIYRDAIGYRQTSEIELWQQRIFKISIIDSDYNPSLLSRQRPWASLSARNSHLSPLNRWRSIPLVIFAYVEIAKTVIKCKSGRIFQKASITTLENIVFIIYVHRDNLNFFVNLFEHRVLENHSTLYFPFNSVSCFAYSSASLDDVSSATKPQICDNVMKPFITTIRRGQITR